MHINLPQGLIDDIPCIWILLFLFAISILVLLGFISCPKEQYFAVSLISIAILVLSMAIYVINGISFSHKSFGDILLSFSVYILIYIATILFSYPMSQLYRLSCKVSLALISSATLILISLFVRFIILDVV